MEGGFFMSDQSRFTIHTSIRPDESKHDKNTVSIKEQTNAIHKSRPITIKAKDKPRRLSASERLFKNTAVACALLLCVMALKNIDSPVTNKITGAVKSVVSMDLNLPSSIQDLAFVQKIMPESALVFLNLTDTPQNALPVSGEIVHAYTSQQPWTEYRSRDNAPVFAVASGKVAASVETGEGDYSVLVSDSEGNEYLYAFLASSSVQAGDEISKGAQIGLTGASERARLYLEYRKSGKAADPEGLLGE